MFAILRTKLLDAILRIAREEIARQCVGGVRAILFVFFEGEEFQGRSLVSLFHHDVENPVQKFSLVVLSRNYFGERVEL